jgi:hypothetical protein
MPCILKERTAQSPGVITFTSNEAVRGVAANSDRVKKFLSDGVRDGSWIFGVHIQGDYSHYDHWPLEPWVSFVMWPEPEARFLANVPGVMKIGLNCINFMPNVPPRPAGMERNVDICVISRPSGLKRIHETLLMLRGLMDRVPQFTATVIAPDPRHVELGADCYDRQEIDRSLYELPTRIFSGEESKRLSFLCSSRDAFGRFPIAVSLLTDIVQRSRFLMLLSHKEGTPRVIAEALLAGTPCILSSSLASGVRPYLSPADTLYVSDDISTAVSQIESALQQYGQFSVDVGRMQGIFSSDVHIPVLRERLAGYIEAIGKPVEGRWFLDDLHLRLPCHGQRHESQFMNRDKLFFDWIECVDSVSGHAECNFNPYDEDAIFGMEPLFSIDKRPVPGFGLSLQTFKSGLQRLLHNR